MGSTVERLLVRTWNLFHGNTKPPGRKAFLEQMVRLASADSPDILLFQEVPVWALTRLAGWSGMTAIGDVAQRPLLGPFPSNAEVGRVLTDLNHGLLRSAFTGQANAMLVDPGLEVIDHRRIALSSFRFRRRVARELGLGIVARLAWSKEGRVCQAVRIRAGDRTLVAGNLHATGYGPDRRIADAELLRAATFVDGLASPDEPVLLGGDFNLTIHNSKTLPQLLTDEWGFHGANPDGIDHILVRGLESGAPRIWPSEWRSFDDRLLSDHAPVEVEVE
jgi:endonuclease/exonuclease/phosphatase family metal-dependent hydrolase